jgi:type IX secretion system PorP/SprF family membrane protein
MKTRIVLFALLFTSVLSYSQQDAQYTQYMYNTINVNPAYAGSRGALSVFALYRAQWIGLEGAPVTSTVSVNTPFNESNLGLGVSIINDKLGPTTENNISADLSYTMQTAEDWKLSFGIKATANLFDLDVSKLSTRDVDNSLQNYSKISPNFGAGFYLHSSNAYLGFSIPNFIETTRYNDEQVAIFTEKINYYFIGGLVFELSDTIKFKPAFLGKMSEGAPLQLDVSGNFLFNDKFMLGATYRWSAAISAMVGFQISDGMYIGYGYDRESTSLSNFNSGSHEIFLRYELFKNTSRMTTPRFF